MLSCSSRYSNVHADRVDTLHACGVFHAGDMLSLGVPLLRCVLQWCCCWQILICIRLLLQQWSLSAAVDTRNPLEFSPSLAECTAAAVFVFENSPDLISMINGVTFHSF